MVTLRSNVRARLVNIVILHSSVWRSVDGKKLMRFQSETFVFKLLQRNVDKV